MLVHQRPSRDPSLPTTKKDWMRHSLRLEAPPFDGKGVLCASGIECRGSYNWRIKEDAVNSLKYSELWEQLVVRASAVPPSMT
jgi:hypothetical protein